MNSLKQLAFREKKMPHLKKHEILIVLSIFKQLRLHLASQIININSPTYIPMYEYSGNKKLLDWSLEEQRLQWGLEHWIIFEKVAHNKLDGVDKTYLLSLFVYICTSLWKKLGASTQSDSLSFGLYSIHQNLQNISELIDIASKHEESINNCKLVFLRDIANARKKIKNIGVNCVDSR